MTLKKIRKLNEKLELFRPKNNELGDTLDIFLTLKLWCFLTVHTSHSIQIYQKQNKKIRIKENECISSCHQ